MMHRLFLPVVASLAVALAIAAPAQAAGGGGSGFVATLGGGGGDHGGFGANLGGGTGHGGMSFSPGGGHAGMGLGSMGLGGRSGTLGLGLSRGIGSTGGDDIHLGLTSRELGLGSNFGLNAPDNVLSRAARLPISSGLPGLGAHAGDRPSLQGLDLKGLDPSMTSDTGHTSQGSKDSRAGNDDAKGINFKKVEEQAGRSEALEEETEESQLEANLPQSPPPPTAAPTTAPPISQPAPTLPESSTVVTTTLGSGEVSMIGAYFAENGAPVASVPTSSVNVSVGGTIPDNVALFPPPYDLANQVSDPDFLYFVWGNNVVIVDGQTNVVTAIVPDVVAHQA